MFRMNCCGSNGDCTSNYNISLDKEYTVKEFIDTVLIEKKNEWGFFKILTDNNLIDGVASYEYKYGKLVGNINEKYLNNKIIGANCSGGWSAMDYFIRI